MEQDFFDEKVSLICEYNPHSPLFIRLANVEIQNNNIDFAIDILNEGIKLFPQFAIAHILLGKTFSLKGRYNEALIAFKTGCELIHSEKSFEFYKQELELFKNSSLNTKKHNSSLENNLSLNDVIKDKSDNLNKSEKNLSSFSVDDNLLEIAEKISKAKIEKNEFNENEPEHIEQISSEGISFAIPQVVDSGRVSPSTLEESDRLFGVYRPSVDSVRKAGCSIDETSALLRESSIGEPKEKLFASETLAKIYIAQGEFQEAIKTYLHLIEKNPLKKNYYQNKIDDLKRKYEL